MLVEETWSAFISALQRNSSPAVGSALCGCNRDFGALFRLFFSMLFRKFRAEEPRRRKDLPSITQYVESEKSNEV